MNRRSIAAFTFVEILVAMTFLGILLPVVVGGLLTANRASVVAERSTVAAQLAENEMSDLLLDDAWSTSSNRGDFGVDYPGYSWSLIQRQWPTDSTMTELTLEVKFQVQGQDHTVSLVTLANDDASASPSPSPSASSGL